LVFFPFRTRQSATAPRCWLGVAFALALLPSASGAGSRWAAADATTLAAGPPKIVRITAGAGDRQIRVHAAMFSNETHTLKVVDDAGGNKTLASALDAAGCSAGVNGGYFHPDRVPLGLLIAGGKTLHPFEKARLLSGLMLVEKGRIRLLRTREMPSPIKASDALQAGPFLVDRAAAVTGLEAEKRAERTVVATDGKGRFALIVTGPLTLAEAASLLATPSLFSEIRIARALNLDGGSSTGFWTRSGTVDIRPWKPVRNFVGISSR
jgi:uncharacterized protein YigE (DUF2233 family)